MKKKKPCKACSIAFNELVQTVRTKENEKNLAAQRLEYLKEREGSLKEFLQKAEGQIKGIDESIDFTSLQVEEEEKSLTGLSEQIGYNCGKKRMTKRNVLDEKRTAVDILRNEYQQVQRSQFDAEKKVAVADTSIQNLQRTIVQIEEERAQREEQRHRLDEERIQKEKELEIKKVDLEQLQQHQDNTKEQILQTQSILDGHCVMNWPKKQESWMQKEMNMIF